jgi:riboflavin kinase/FMN adenylyltransferase
MKVYRGLQLPKWPKLPKKLLKIPSDYSSVQFIKQTLKQTPSANSTPQGAVVSIGNFDGVHRGHAQLFQHMVKTAKEQNLRTCVVTFEPHPKTFFNPKQAPACINRLRDRCAWIAACGIDEVYILRFNQGLAELSPKAFIEFVLLKQLNTQHLWVGDDFRFGHNRQGNFNTLKQAGTAHKFQVNAITSVQYNQQRISSSIIRQFLHTGNIELATTALGHPLTYSGHVLHGEKLGRTLGFPTLNLSLGKQTSALRGVLAVWVHGLDHQPLAGVASLGTRPSVQNNGQYWLETFVLNWNGNAYGKKITVEVVQYLRPETKFSGLDTLVAQMKLDAVQAQTILEKQPATLPLFNLNQSLMT